MRAIPACSSESLSACTSTRPPTAFTSRMPSRNSASVTCGYEGSDTGMKALNPAAPSAHWPAISGIDGAVSAPQRPKSTTTLRLAISRFSRYSSVVVTGG